MPSQEKYFIDASPSSPPERVKVVLFSLVEVPPKSTYILNLLSGTGKKLSSYFLKRISYNIELANSIRKFA